MITMKKIVLLSFLLITSYFAFAQCNRMVDEKGDLLWQYHRSIASQSDENKVEVTFVFINGVQQQVVAYRQENYFSTFTWSDTTAGITSIDKKVQCIQANLAPNEAVSWTFTLTDEKMPLLEKAAVLIIDDQYGVRKERLDAEEY